MRDVRGFQGSDLVGAQVQRERRHRVGEVARLRGPDDRSRDAPLPRHPGERHLCPGHAARGCDLCDRLKHGAVRRLPSRVELLAEAKGVPLWHRASRRCSARIRSRPATTPATEPRAWLCLRTRSRTSASWRKRPRTRPDGEAGRRLGGPHECFCPGACKPFAARSRLLWVWTTELGRAFEALHAYYGRLATRFRQDDPG